MTPLDWTYAVRDVPIDGLAIERTVTSDEAMSLAQELEIVSVESLTAKCHLTPRAGGRLSLKGTIFARLTQECVVTLDPISVAVSLPVDVVFTPQAGITAGIEMPMDGSLEDLDAPDEEPIENGTVNVGRIVFEELLSGLDPYPRSPNANFDWADEKAGAADKNPFATLARLKKADIE